MKEEDLNLKKRKQENKEIILKHLSKLNKII